MNHDFEHYLAENASVLAVSFVLIFSVVASLWTVAIVLAVRRRRGGAR